jgi:SAM-dependent methyltransferase
MSRLGWEGVGVDLDGVAVQTATERFGVTAFEGTIESTRFPTSSFDVVTMHHVFEHLSDPMKTLAECYRVLRPGGKLVIVTPNAESLASRLSGPTWLGWDPPRHLFIFSQRALREVVIRSGFKVCELHTLARGAYEVWSESRLLWKHDTLPLCSLNKILLNLEARFFWITEYILSRRWDVGEELLIIATK